MKKLCFLLYFVLLVFTAKAQSILGIPFGSSYETVKNRLESRFGSVKVFEDGGNLSLISPVIGDYEFKMADFYFQRENGSSWLSNVIIQTYFDVSDINRAKSVRDDLANVLKQKYSVEEYTNDEGYKCYGFGTNPKDENKFLCILFLNKSKGKDGVQRLYLILEYGRIYYIDRTSDF